MNHKKSNSFNDYLCHRKITNPFYCKDTYKYNTSGIIKLIFIYINVYLM
jgi:hypothetical protein